MQISKPKKTKTTYSQILQPYRYAKSRKEYCCAPLIVQELPPQVSKASPEPGEVVLIPKVGSTVTIPWQLTIQPYPEDLVDWLKSSGSSSSSNIPTPSCEPSINFDDAKDLKQIIIAISDAFSKPGLPIF